MILQLFTGEVGESRMKHNLNDDVDFLIHQFLLLGYPGPGHRWLVE